MGVYIPNIEMPNSCGECQFICKESTCRYGKGYERSDFCPLVEVPKHGRLIDADELAKLEVIPSDNWVFRAIEKAPTIIEAETCNKPDNTCNKQEYGAVNASIESEGEDG